MIDIILQKFNCFCVSHLDRKLKADRVEVLCDLRTFLAIAQGLVALFDCFERCNADRMRIPGVYVFSNEFLIYIFENPVAYLVFSDVTFDITV
jgi:hypothetical protein